MSNYIISPEAVRDLEEIFDYFLSQNISTGEAFIEEFNKKCRNLVKFPYLGRSYAEISPGVRGVPLLSYIIFYRVVDNRIEII